MKRRSFNQSVIASAAALATGSLPTLAQEAAIKIPSGNVLDNYINTAIKVKNCDLHFVIFHHKDVYVSINYNGWPTIIPYFDDMRIDILINPNDEGQFHVKTITRYDKHEKCNHASSGCFPCWDVNRERLAYLAHVVTKGMLNSIKNLTIMEQSTLYGPTGYKRIV